MDHPVTFTGAALPETQPLGAANQLLLFILLSYIYFYVLDQAQHPIYIGKALSHFATLRAQTPVEGKYTVSTTIRLKIEVVEYICILGRYSFDTVLCLLTTL